MPLIKIDAQWAQIEQIYASDNNFTGERIYKSNDAYLHKDAIAPFIKAAELLKRQGYRLKVFDAFRPTEAQARLFEHTPDPSFVAPPERGSNHTRGCAVDVTLIDLSGNELYMGTDFDCFSERSSHGNMEISKEAQHNRLILLGAMISAGFDYEPKEWWHYQLKDAEHYPLLSADSAPGLI